MIEGSSVVPWCFFYSLPSLTFLKQGEKPTKEGVLIDCYSFYSCGYPLNNFMGANFSGDKTNFLTFCVKWPYYTFT